MLNTSCSCKTYLWTNSIFSQSLNSTWSQTWRGHSDTVQFLVSCWQFPPMCFSLPWNYFHRGIVDRSPVALTTKVCCFWPSSSSSWIGTLNLSVFQGFLKENMVTVKSVSQASQQLYCILLTQLSCSTCSFGQMFTKVNEVGGHTGIHLSSWITCVSAQQQTRRTCLDQHNSHFHYSILRHANAEIVSSITFNQTALYHAVWLKSFLASFLHVWYVLLPRNPTGPLFLSYLKPYLKNSLSLRREKLVWRPPKN